MITANIQYAADFNGWRVQARLMLDAEIEPAHVLWQIAGASSDLFASQDATTVQADSVAQPKPQGRENTHLVPREFIALAEKVVCHCDESRFALLYRVLWRMTHGEAGLLQRVTDDDVHALTGFAKAVSRDRHKMTAFVRFRKTLGSEHEHYSAWFEPSHHILRLTSRFFCKRFANMDWSIYTPEGSAHWNQSELVFGPPGTRKDMPDGEIMEQLWCTYFSNIFNPARLRLEAMRSEMPVKYWKNLPEAPIIAKLTREAGARTSRMVEAAPSAEPRFAKAALYQGAKAPIAHSGSLDQLRDSARNCCQCAHACDATQTVFGTGSETSRLMIVGEQPGDIEDVQGRPFVGPSGKLIRSMLDELSIDQDSIYFTNAVKHFKYTIRGKRRLHQSPSAGDIEHCRGWLVEEIALIKPLVIIALGRTAASSLFGRPVQLEQERGTLHSFGETGHVMVTHHPARILRATNKADRNRFETQLLADLGMAISSLPLPEDRAGMFALH